MTGSTENPDDGAVEPDAGPSEHAIRLKAYELWERGGRMNGSDRDDWFRATAILTRPQAASSPEAPSATEASEPHTAVELVAEGLHNAVSLVADAAQTVANLFGSQAGAKEPAEKPKGGRSSKPR